MAPSAQQSRGGIWQQLSWSALRQRPSGLARQRRAGRHVACDHCARPGRLSRESGDQAVRSEHSMVKPLLSRTPGADPACGSTTPGSVDRRRCRRRGPGVRARSSTRGRPGRCRGHLGRGAAHRLAPVPGWQRAGDGGRVLVCDCGGPAGLPGSVWAEDQAGGGGAHGHRAGPPWRDLLQPGRPRRARHGRPPSMDRVLAKTVAARVRHRELELGPARGAGASTAVQCFPSAAAESAFLGKYAFFPVGPRQQRGCTSAGGASSARSAPPGTAALRLGKHVSTADYARDLNLLRQALGQAKLDYLGISYGTYLGATYANLFPHRVGPTGARWERPAQGLDQRRAAEPPG